ncbi:hypothetical protein [Kingella oralis]|nr:hypothetical protein [Kingella oralis]
MERRLAAKWWIKQSITGLPRCRRAADAPLVVLRFSGCLFIAMRQPENG